MRRILGVDRVSIGALALADLGVGLYLIGTGEVATWINTLAGVLGILLAMPAAVAAISGRLPSLADEGVLVNIGVWVFITCYVAFLTGPPLRVLGFFILLVAATAATTGMYLRMFRAVRTPSPAIAGRHA